ncbi:MAG: M48 family metallopeptidase [Pseudomonadota bacterium]
MKYVAKEIPEGINVTPRHPLINFAYLLGTVVIASVLIFVTLGFIAQWLTTRISPETERKIGQMMIHVIEDEEIQDDRRIQYLEELLHSLPKSGETIRLPLTIHLVKSDVVNAAIMAGGHVLIHTALLETVKSENELALVLAHELGHFQARDPLKSLGRSLVFVAISAIIGISESGGLPQIIPLTSQLTNLSYSRKQESAADIYALSRVVSRYGHGGHSLDFFKRLETEEEQGRLLKMSEYFSTHPLSGARVDDLNQEAAEKGWSMEGDVTPLPKWLPLS